MSTLCALCCFHVFIYIFFINRVAICLQLIAQWNNLNNYLYRVRDLTRMQCELFSSCIRWVKKLFTSNHLAWFCGSYTVPLKCKLPLPISFLARHVSFLSRRVSFLSRRVSFLSRRVSFRSRITEAFSLEYIIHVLLPRSQCAYLRRCYYTHF